MKFNKYIWELYMSSETGKRTIEDSKPFKEIPNSEEFLLVFEEDEVERIKQSGQLDFLHEGKVNILKIYYNHFSQKPFFIEKADELFSQWINEGVNFAGIDILKKEEDSQWWADIEYISNALYVCFPEFFFPYFFQHKFDEFSAICEEYNIALPEIPKKRHRRERTTYYLDICRILHEFRTNNELSPEELIAFIYDFAPKSLSIKNMENGSLSEPSKVWYVGGGKTDFDFLDGAESDETSFWQSNLDTRIGDIIIMYCWSPRSYIHSVWRAVNDGFIDPFFYYHSLTYISNPIRVPPIAFHEIKSNSVLAKSPIVKNNFQGVNGYPVTQEEYNEMLKLWAEKGMNISTLPKIEGITYLSEDIILRDERDIEVHLIEPLLHKLKYNSTDWIRQMPIRMGRGERNYPDYCFGAVTTRGEESAKMLIEAKYSIKNRKMLSDAYFQAKSYAIRLQADKFVVASKEGLWIYNQQNGKFELEKSVFYTWNDLGNADKLFELSKMIGKKLKNK
ncbi:MAG: hypothetical protein IPN74_05575 [Haliscomenobacter sp.]|nr:hypothetical protein [Haliscomenobacter sp.]MBK8878022.1 hypothetical protein [Haliscomenobacter sp.]